jgi:hypothetical protein
LSKHWRRSFDPTHQHAQTEACAFVRTGGGGQTFDGPDADNFAGSIAIVGARDARYAHGLLHAAADHRIGGKVPSRTRICSTKQILPNMRASRSFCVTIGHGLVGAVAADLRRLAGPCAAVPRFARTTNHHQSLRSEAP